MIQAVKGTKDILPDTVNNWYFFEGTFRKSSAKFGYRELRTPIFEKTEVFSRSIGDNTDIVNKEMYTFLDKSGESITLRPEMTAALVRSVLQNSMLHDQPLLRLWYFGPFFRYERPQKGRLRQFHQYGAECLGSAYPESDVEVILLANNIIASLGIPKYKLFLNSLGNEASRINYKDKLISFLKDNNEKLSYDSRMRLEANPLRILDSKDEGDLEVLAHAPVITDYLDHESRSHFETVKSFLSDSGIEYEIQPRLVRGLDYYSHTVFEFQSSYLGAQDSFGGGGRYDGLFEQLGSKRTPAVGFAFGVERLMLILEALNNTPEDYYKCDLYMINLSPEAYAISMKIAGDLRNKGMNVMLDLLKRSFKSQIREANKLGAKWTIIIGEDEINSGTAIVKNMNDGEQIHHEINDLVNLDFNTL